MEKWQKDLAAWRKTPFISRLLAKYPQAEVFLVGGAVRDAILGRKTNDFDFVVRGVAKKDLQKFLTTQGKVDLVGKRFGVFKFRLPDWQGEAIDIALPRTEHAVTMSGAYRDFKINSNASLKIEDDLSRRDFTINALAFQIAAQSNQLKAKSALIDPFNGLSDLKKGIVRTVGNPELRFKEDYSRILRAIRFACQLDFEIEAKTWKSILKNIKNLNKKIGAERVVPYEVIAKELVKAVGRNPLWALELLDKSGAVKQLFPELLRSKKCPQPKIFHSEGDCWVHMLLAVASLFSKKFKNEFKAQVPAEVVWAAIFHDIAKPYTMTVSDRIRFNNHDALSAKMWRQAADHLKLSSAGLKTEITEQLILKHMLPVHSQVKAMKDTTLEKYFFNPNFPGDELLMLIFADVCATVPPSGKPDFSSYKLLKKRIAALAKKGLNKKILPPPLVNGHDLIRQFKLESSPQIGKLLLLLREAQLSGQIKDKKAGLALINKVVKKYKGKEIKR